MARLVIICLIGSWLVSCIAYEAPAHTPMQRPAVKGQKTGYCSAKVEAGICAKFSDGNVGGFTFSEFETAVTGVYRTGTLSVPISGSVAGSTYQLSACYKAFRFDISLDREIQKGKGRMRVGDEIADFELYPFGAPPSNQTNGDSGSGSVVGLWDFFAQKVTPSTVAFMKNDSILYMSPPTSNTCNIYIGTLGKTEQFNLYLLVDHSDDYTALRGVFNVDLTTATATMSHSSFDGRLSNTQVVLKKQVIED